MRKTSLVALAACVLAVGCDAPEAALFDRFALLPDRVLPAVVIDGTVRIQGTVRAPAALLRSGGSTTEWEMVPDASVRIEAIDNSPGFSAVSVKSEASGAFLFKQVPNGSVVSLTATFQGVQGAVTQRRLLTLDTTEPLVCAHIDLASTLLADKILSASANLNNREALNGQNLPFLIKQNADLYQEEQLLRAALRQDPVEPDRLLEAVAQGSTETLFTDIAKSSDALKESYDSIFHPTDTNLGFQVAALTPDATNSLGGIKRTKVFGVARYRISGAPPDTARVEYWLVSPTSRLKLEDATQAPDFASSVDTWAFADGGYTLQPVLVLQNGRRILISSFPFDLSNDINAQCPLPE